MSWGDRLQEVPGRKGNREKEAGERSEVEDDV